MSCVKKAAEFKRVRLKESLTTAYQIDYFFEIPESITLPSENKCLPSKLPPSIRVVKSALYTVSGICDIVYYIEARVMKHAKLVSYAIRDIIIIPTAEIPPPVDPGDFKKEFQLANASSFGSFWNSTSNVTVVASSMEPRPLVFPVNKGEYGSTELLLDFKTQSGLDGDGEIMGSQLTACEVTITLEAVTYFLTHQQESVMSMDEALQSLVTVLKRTTFKTEKRYVPLTEWQKGRVIVCELIPAIPSLEKTDSKTL
jgi:hypothetical protein